MRRGSINGIPVWIKLVENSLGERTVIKEAPGIDGAVVETQGQMPVRYRFEFSLISDGEWIVDDYDTATLDLRAAFLNGGPFTVETPVFDELTDLWMEGAVTLPVFNSARQQITEGSVTFVEARPGIILQENAAADVQGAISALTEAAAKDFARRVPEDSSFLDRLLAVLDAIGEWLSAVQGIISSAFQPINDISGAIATLKANVESLLRAPQNYAAQLMGTAGGLLSLVPSLSAQGDTSLGSAAVQDAGNDKPAIVLIEALDLGTDFDSDLAPSQGDILGDDASEEDLLENDHRDAGLSICLSAVTASVCNAIASTSFATVNSVLDVADALEPAFEALFEVENLDYLVISGARALRAATRSVLADQAAGLPRLRNFTAPRDTDALNVLVDLYDELPSEDVVQAAVESILDLNWIPDPTNITRGTTLRYLDPLLG